MISAAQKELDEIFRDFNPRMVEEQKKINFEISPAIGLALEDYQRHINGCNGATSDEREEPEVMAVLSPPEINFILQTISSDDKVRENYGGHFIDRLMQKSYDHGYNDFHLDLDEKNIGELSCKLKGREHNPLRITVRGSRFPIAGRQSRYITMDLQGHAQMVGIESLDSTYIIGGNTIHLGPSNGFRKPRLYEDYFIQGTGPITQRCTFILLGTIALGAGRSCYHCTFKVYSMEQAERLYATIPQENTIILIRPEGEQVICRG